MGRSTALHPQAALAIDSVNNRVILEYQRGRSVHRVEQYRASTQSFVEVVDALLKDHKNYVIPAKAGIRISANGGSASGRKSGMTNIWVGVYPGPGPFTKVRTGVLVAHWIARERFGTSSVSHIPLKAFDQPLLNVWGKFKTETQAELTVVYGKKSNITIRTHH